MIGDIWVLFLLMALVCIAMVGLNLFIGGLFGYCFASVFGAMAALCGFVAYALKD